MKYHKQEIIIFSLKTFATVIKLIQPLSLDHVIRLTTKIKRTNHVYCNNSKRSYGSQKSNETTKKRYYRSHVRGCREIFEQLT